MAAIDPSEQPHEADGSAHPLRATLKIIRAPGSPDESELDSDEGYDDDESEDEEKKAGPSDPSKALKFSLEKAVAKLKKAVEAKVDRDVKINGHDGINGTASSKAKGKERATEVDDGDRDELEMDEFVLCTLDPAKNYQQPLDIVVGEDENVFFKVSGTHTVYLTGNYMIPNGNRLQQDMDMSDEDEEEYELSLDEEDEMDVDEESDELDDLEDPRIMELGLDDEEPPKLVKKDDAPKSALSKSKQPEQKKSTPNKRHAEDEEPANLDDIMAKSLKPEAKTTNGEPKLSKKQLKKMKNNAGQPADPPVAGANDQNTPNAETGSKDKKVQFAKDLENVQPVEGQSGKANGKADGKAEGKTGGKANGKAKNESGTNAKPGQSLGVKTVQGVVMDDRKMGTGPAAKNGDKLSLRYIGKLQNGTVFDANKSGTPFRFKLGAGEVVKGWDIGIVGMSAGGERRITIPPHLGYGKKAMPKIPSNSTLIFEVKLLSIG